jgi:hypothetical protein
VEAIDDAAQFDDHSVRELLALSRSILRELRRRGVTRTGNAPTGDYAELLVQQATGGELAANSQRSWDVRTPPPDDARLQVKARIVTGSGRGERQLSPFRTWDFEAALIVLFGDDYGVLRASEVSVDELRAVARWAQHVNGWLVFATDALLDRGEDWTERLRSAAV